MGKQSSLIEALSAQKPTLHGEGYTTRDVYAKLRYSKTAVHNAIARLWSPGDVLACGLEQEHSGCFRLKTYGNKFQYCYEMSQQGICTQVPQASSEATPDTCDEKRDWSLHVDIAIAQWKLSGKSQMNRSCNSVYLPRGTW